MFLKRDIISTVMLLRSVFWGSHMAPNCYATISVAVRMYVHYITYRDGQYKLRSTSARIFHVRDMVPLDNIGIDEQ